MEFFLNIAFLSSAVVSGPLFQDDVLAVEIVGPSSFLALRKVVANLLPFLPKFAGSESYSRELLGLALSGSFGRDFKSARFS